MSKAFVIVDGRKLEMAELSEKDFLIYAKVLANTVGIPAYWSKGLGVLPQPASDKMKIVMEV